MTRQDLTRKHTDQPLKVMNFDVSGDGIDATGSSGQLTRSPAK